MKLSEMPLEEIRAQVNSLKVRSDNTHRLGLVTEVSAELDREDYSVVIVWEDLPGVPAVPESYVWHFWCNKITVEP